MASHYDVCKRWIEYVRWNGRPHKVRPLSSRSVYFEGSTIYSYGRHFPLAEYYAAGRHGRTRPLILLNGDRNSVTTARHQGEIRAAVASAIQGTWSELESIIVPFSALDSAGIRRSTIRPLEVRPDRVDRWTEKVPGDFGAVVWGPATADRFRASSQTGRIPNSDGATARRYVRHYDYTARKFVDVDIETAEISYYTAGGSVINVDTEGNGTVDRTRHWLGDSLFTAEVSRTVRRRRPVSVRDVVSAARWNELETLPDMIEETATVSRRQKFLSSFDYNEPRALYFLATMPAGRAKTVDHAIDELAPRAVHAAMARGIDVERQGDIFAIATALTDSDVYGRAVSRARRTQWTNGAVAKRGEIGAPSAADTAKRYRAAKRDRAEWRRRYRELRAAQWAAWDGLPDKPRSARDKAMGMAMNRGGHRLYRESYRHAATALLHATQATMAKYDRPRHQYQTTLRAALSIYGTAHTATEVVKTRGGAVYVRGIMYHEPSLEPGRGGERDHIRRPLGDRSTWYLALRNTVPRAA